MGGFTGDEARGRLARWLPTVMPHLASTSCWDFAEEATAAPATLQPLAPHRYRSLVYGGRVPTVRPVAFDTNAPAAAFASPEFADLFFR